VGPFVIGGGGNWGTNRRNVNTYKYDQGPKGLFPNVDMYKYDQAQGLLPNVNTYKYDRGLTGDVE
jgi:hypothetical protein